MQAPGAAPVPPLEPPPPVTPSTAASSTTSREALIPQSEEESGDVCGTAPSQKRRLWTTSLLALAFSLGRADWLMLGAVFTPLGRDLQASPSQLGTITLWRALTQALLSPLSGALGDSTNRVHVVAAGLVVWGGSTALFAAVSTLAQAISAAAFIGLGLALVQPCAQSLTADFFSPSARGRAFGTLYTLQAVGGVAGGFWATSISGKAPLGIEGWRFAFYTVAILAGLAGLLTLTGRDPRGKRYLWGKGRREGSRGKGLRAKWVAVSEALKSYGRTLKTVLRVKSFQVLVLQGIFGGMPWIALSFITSYLQLLGFGDVAAAGLTSLTWGGTCVGNLLGGIIGDGFTKWLGPRGRPLTCQLSVLSGLPLTLLLFRLPRGSGVTGSADNLFPSYAALLFVFGLLVSWPQTNNSAVFAEVVPEDKRSSVYAFDGCFEGAVAALSAPLVGILAERCFGYKVDAQGSADPAWRLANAEALGKGLQVSLMVPWSLEALAYCLLYFTFPRDRLRALAAASPAPRA